MLKKITWSLCLLLISIFAHAQQTVPDPASYFGFKPGSDHHLFGYEKMIAYLEILDQHSDRLEMREIGESPLGKPMYIAFFSLSDNISRLNELKLINQQLSMNPDLSSREQDSLVSKGKVFILSTLSMHSGEVGPSQSAPLIAYDIITTHDPEKLKWLEEVVFMMVPCHNPDGMDMVVDYYNETKGTVYEGASHPGVYHKYVGHDNNRDFVMLSQKDTKVISEIYSQEWFPQVFVEKHQMGSTGPRYFVPPNHDPIAENVDEGIWNWSGVFGSNMIKDLTSAGLSGVTQHYLFDDYWPGSTETCIWKNTIGFLTEAASAKYAKPIYVEPTELQVAGKGLSEYKKSINMPLPWEGGWWRLSDIIEYELVSTESIIRTSAQNKESILKFRNNLCKKEVRKGKEKAPFYYIMPVKQHDPSELVFVVNLLREHGIKVFQLSDDLYFNSRHFRKDDIVIPLSQPFRAFIKEVMEKQIYPLRHYTPDGEIIKPYDITSWSLPLHNGLTSFEMNESIGGIEDNLIEIESDYSLYAPEDPGDFLILPANYNDSYRAAFYAMNNGFKIGRVHKDQEINGKKIMKGNFVVPVGGNPNLGPLLDQLTVSPFYVEDRPEFNDLDMPSIALVESWFHDMDAGWTRFVLDSNHVPYDVVRPADIKENDLEKYDVIIFPDENKSILLNGKYQSGDSYYVSNYEPKYAKGMEKEGLQKIFAFIESGGKVVSWGGSASLFEGAQKIEQSGIEEEFQLPFLDISSSLAKKGLYCPGSLVEIRLTGDHPVNYGMPEKTAIFSRGRPVFTTSIPGFGIDRKVLGVTPEDDILLSGYCENEKLMGNKCILLWMQKGEGQLVLMGFSPQFRASTHTSYKLLFNSLLLPDKIMK